MEFVSGLLVFSDHERRPLAKESALSFLRQHWPHKRLIVYNATGRRLFWFRRASVKELMLAKAPPGSMLETAFFNAEGSHCALWRDDCVYAPEYLPSLMAHAGRDNLVLLKAMTLIDQETGSTLVVDARDCCAVFPRCRGYSFGKRLEQAFHDIKLVSLPAQIVHRAVRSVRA